jgi:hypothetical protein
MVNLLQVIGDFVVIDHYDFVVVMQVVFFTPVFYSLFQTLLSFFHKATHSLDILTSFIFHSKIQPSLVVQTFFISLTSHLVIDCSKGIRIINNPFFGGMN